MSPPGLVRTTAQDIVSAAGMMEREPAHRGHLVDDIHVLRHLENGQLTLERSLIALDAVAADAIELAGPALDRDGHDVLLVAPAESLLVHGDPVRLTQAVLNLLLNAATFTPPGGAITVTLGRAANGEATLAVSDNGIGLLPAQCDSVFGLYVQAGDAVAGGRLGIGLYLVRALVELHGGRATAASAGLGQGSTFTIVLPAAAPMR